MQIVLCMYLLQRLVAYCCWLYELPCIANETMLLEAADNFFKFATVKRVKLLNAKKRDVVVRVVHYRQLLGVVIRPGACMGGRSTHHMRAEGGMSACRQVQLM